MRGSRKITSLARALAPFANRTAGSVVDRIISAAAGAGTFVDANTIHLSGAVILLRHPGAARLAEYPATTEGLQAALGAAVAGDTVLLPGGEISLPVAAGGTYVPGADLATVNVPGTAAQGGEFTGLEPGRLYAIETRGLSKYSPQASGGVIMPESYTTFNLSDDGGASWSGRVGGWYDGYTDIPFADAPTFAEHAETWIEDVGYSNKVRGRVYWRPSGTSVRMRCHDGTQNDWSNNSGSLDFYLREASVEGGSSLLEIPAGVEVLGLGKNTILDGDLVNNGTLTNLTVTGTVTGTGKLRMVYNASGEQITDLVGFAAADHDHDTAYAAISHDHAAGDIDSTGASDGQVLTADGLGGAAWETPAGGSVAASAVTVDASGFAGNLSAADTDVQTALQTIDAMTVSGGGAAPGHAETIGDGAATSYTITHDLGTADVIVQVYDLEASPNPVLVDATVEIVDEDTVLVAFDSPPSTDQYRVVVVAVSEGAGAGGGDLTRIGYYWAHSSDVATVDIPISTAHRAAYSALRVVAHVRSTVSTDDVDGLRIQFSTGGTLDTGNNYARRAEETGNQTATENNMSGDSIWVGRYGFPGASTAANVFGLGDMVITGWGQTGTFTTCHGMSHVFTLGTLYRTNRFYGMWKNAGLVDNIRFYLERGNFAAGSWIAVYGMK